MTIPDDVMKAADELHTELDGMVKAEYNGNGWLPVEAVPLIARALMAERERCAKVADADKGLAPGAFGKPDFGPNTALRIAAAIRKGE